MGNSNNKNNKNDLQNNNNLQPIQPKKSFELNQATQEFILPKEILIEIFLYVDYTTFSCVAATCQSFYFLLPEIIDRKAIFNYYSILQTQKTNEKTTQSFSHLFKDWKTQGKEHFENSSKSISFEQLMYQILLGEVEKQQKIALTFDIFYEICTDNNQFTAPELFLTLADLIKEEEESTNVEDIFIHLNQFISFYFDYRDGIYFKTTQNILVEFERLLNLIERIERKNEIKIKYSSQMRQKAFDLLKPRPLTLLEKFKLQMPNTEEINFSLEELMKHKNGTQIFAEHLNYWLYTKIAPFRLICNTINRMNSKNTSLGLYISKFNEIEKCLVNQIVSVPDIKKRAKVLSFVIDSAYILSQQGHTFPVTAIDAALQDTAVYRLYKTRALASKKTVEKQEELFSLTSPSKNYQALRMSLKEGNIALSIFLADLSFIFEGHSTLNSKQVNFYKINLLEKTTQTFFSFSREPPLPSVISVELFRFFEKSLSENLPPDTLYLKSLEVEPRGQ